MRFILIFLSLSYITNAQLVVPDEITEIANKQYKQLSLDHNNLHLNSHHVSSLSRAHHYYFNIKYDGYQVFNQLGNATFFDDSLMFFSHNFNPDLDFNYQKNSKYTAIEAIHLLIDHYAVSDNMQLRLVAYNSNVYTFNAPETSQEPIHAQLGLYHIEGKLRLVWNVDLYLEKKDDWWSVIIDANSGEVIEQNNWVIQCKHENCTFENNSRDHHSVIKFNSYPNSSTQSQYNVLPLPIESPFHGAVSLINDPDDSLSSPFGWHDVNGLIGADYTITRGNNVHAYEDTASNNSPGYSPEGGTQLSFNFNYNVNDEPTNNLDAAITNLFYVNNRIHDVFYHYGFDEASGNFQENNYGRGGISGDYVRAEAQDGSGTNNANFATPPDGSRPRMQMYIWPFSFLFGNYLNITSPTAISGPVYAARAQFGPPMPAVPIQAGIVLVEDAFSPSNDACDSILNASALNGKIALLFQGSCPFDEKVKAVQDAGAVAAIIVSTLGVLLPMAGDDTSIYIPSMMIRLNDANPIINAIDSGFVVQANINNQGHVDKDSDMDNGIILHEYGHGISNRLTGGGSNTNCLRNDEQMGEGWSDWFALMLTMEPGDSSHDLRGIGTYVKNQANTGQGIRPAPYSTDFNINDYTYGDSNNSNDISKPHGLGFLFASALWDLNWALIDQYGGQPNMDWINGNGGNNIAMKLVMEALKIQPCSPGMLDGRDAILMADQLLYNGIHRCLIWEVFAKRGFGYSASQGSSFSRFDQVEAFDTPGFCLVATLLPEAGFTDDNSSSCRATINFSDTSNQAQNWNWNFGDGNTSTLQNPTHTYNQSGIYNVELIVSNNLGSDTITKTINLTLPLPVLTQDRYTCLGDDVIMTAQASGIPYWYDQINRLLHTGDSLLVEQVNINKNYKVYNHTGNSSEFLGLIDTIAGSVQYSNDGNFRGMNFTTNRSMELLSTEVFAQGNGLRTIRLYEGHNFSNTEASAYIDEVSFYLNSGKHLLYLQLNVPDSGNYHIGGKNLKLYKNDNGALYPYNSTNLNLIGPNDSIDTDDYNFFYNLQVQEPRCVSNYEEANAIPLDAAFNYLDSGLTYHFSPINNDATSWFWDFGDGNFSNLQNPTHTYATDGAYQVTLNVNDSSCVYQETINILTNTENLDAEIKCSILPNPNSGRFLIDITSTDLNIFNVQIITLEGKIIEQLVVKSGINEIILRNSLSPGMYFLKIRNTSYNLVKKLIIH